MWQEEPANRSSWILAVQGNAIHWVRPHYLQDQDHSAKGDETRDAPVHTWRPPEQGALPPKGKNTVFWPKITYDIQQLIEKCMVCQEYGKFQPHLGATPISMAHTGDRFVLLEKNGLSDSCRCLFQVHPSEEIAQYYLCSCVHRIVYDCHWVGFSSYN